jgi:hypothetical protein
MPGDSHRFGVLPDRIGAAVVGAQKCGTTSLAAALALHPDVCLAAGKEAHLFDRPDVQANGPTDADIDTSFPGRRPGQLLLDATPAYLYLPGCLEALVRHAPHVRIVVVLRSPAERAVSHHGHERRLGFERLPLLAALAVERRRLRAETAPLAPDSAHRHSSYLDRGRYAVQLRRLAALTERHHIVYFRDLVERPEATIARVVEFLGLELDHGAPPAGEFPHLNAGDGRRRRFVTAAARAATRRDRTEAESFLGLPAGFLR